MDDIPVFNVSEQGSIGGLFTRSLGRVNRGGLSTRLLRINFGGVASREQTSVPCSLVRPLFTKYDRVDRIPFDKLESFFKEGLR